MDVCNLTIHVTFPAAVRKVIWDQLSAPRQMLMMLCPKKKNNKLHGNFGGPSERQIAKSAAQEHGMSTLYPGPKKLLPHQKTESCFSSSSSELLSPNT